MRDIVLTGAGDPSAYSDNVLPDIYSGTFSYAYNGLSTTGARVVVQRKISEDLTAPADYSTGGVVSAKTAAGSWQDLPQILTTDRQHSVGAKFSGYIPVTKTRWATSYRCPSGSALTPGDAFNPSPPQMDPYSHTFVPTPLPNVAFVPGKMEALLDLRNMM